MERIGIAASKIAKGNLLVYNLIVVLITFLFALSVFFLAGCSIVIILIITAYITSVQRPPDLEKGWMPIMYICMIGLAVINGFFALCALVKNIRFRKAPSIDHIDSETDK